MKIGNFTIEPCWGNLPLSKYKSLEYQLEGKSFASDDPIVLFKYNRTKKQDHAGANISFGLLRLFWFNISVYDHRHWDDENNCWENY
jgi:hypothetical protein